MATEWLGKKRLVYTKRLPLAAVMCPWKRLGVASIYYSNDFVIAGTIPDLSDSPISTSISVCNLQLYRRDGIIKLAIIFLGRCKVMNTISD